MSNHILPIITAAQAREIVDSIQQDPYFYIMLQNVREQCYLGRNYYKCNGNEQSWLSVKDNTRKIKNLGFTVEHKSYSDCYENIIYETYIRW